MDKLKTPFYFGGAASCTAAIIVHPLDLTKVRLQNNKANVNSGMFRTMATIFRSEGPLALYGGLSASILRQGTYATIRFGGYEAMKQYLMKSDQNLSVWKLLLCSTVGGVAGGVCGNPVDIVNVRMQNDGQLPSYLKRNYKHAIDGLVRIIKEEGINALFRGVGPNMNRAILMTSSQCVSYDGIKEIILKNQWMREGIFLHLTSSVMAGLIATTACSPVDIIKTRMMSATGKDVGGSAFGVARTMLKTEGIASFFKGWTPSFMRTGPQTIFTFLFLEQFKKWHLHWHQTHNNTSILI